MALDAPAAQVGPSLSNQCPYLTDKNTHLFLGEGGTVEQIRLVIGGEPVKPATSIAGASAPGAGPAGAASVAPMESTAGGGFWARR